MKQLELAIFRHMAICCPYCDGMCDGCDWCNETGICCPKCRGAGFLSRHKNMKGSILERCSLCQIGMSGGYEYDPSRAMDAVDRYIVDWFDGKVFDEVESKRRENEKIREETEAMRQQYKPVWKHG